MCTGTLRANSQDRRVRSERRMWRVCVPVLYEQTVRYPHLGALSRLAHLAVAAQVKIESKA